MNFIMVSFEDKLFSEYVIPASLSIWKGDGIVREPVEDIDVLIKSCVDELGSDVLIDCYVEATGMVTRMPDDTITVSSATLSSSFPFQGNRLIKATFDPYTKNCYLRYYPAIIAYKRKLNLQDLDVLTGDRLIFVKSYILWKMAEKELSILTHANMTIDNGSVNLSSLESFKTKMYERYTSLKEGILLYSTVY